MKNLAKLVLAAIIGSGITLGASQLLEEDALPQVDQQGISSPAYPTAWIHRSSGTQAESPVDFTVAAEKVMPAVVHIRSSTQRNVQNNTDREDEDTYDMFRDFFGDNFRRFFENPEDMPREGIGSGVIIQRNGYIVTNNHVIDGADEIEVSLYDNRTYQAQVVGIDPNTDIALIKIEEETLPYLSIANSDEVKVGEWVLAVGNPFNLSSTVTAGIVSAKGRAIGILRERYAVESFIQTDAAVNVGNSGGALVDLNGDLIGINTAIASMTGTYAGYAFAVPSNIVAKVVDDLKSYGTVQRGVLGVFISTVNNEIVQQNKLNIVSGVLVDSVLARSAALEAGIKKGDVITKVEDITVKSVADLQAIIAQHGPGDVVNLTINRNGNTKAFAVNLKNIEGNTEIVRRERTEVFNTLGVELEELSDREVNELNIQGGVRVSRLLPGKLRQDTDMQEGFIITKIDSKPIRFIKDIEQLLDGKSGGVLIEGIYPESPDDVRFYAFGM